MKIDYFYSTWAATCVASTGGAFYAALVATVISRGQFGLMEISVVMLIFMVLALPILFLGSAAVGTWVTKFLARRVRRKRMMVFALVGMGMGLIVQWALFDLRILFGGFPMNDVPREMDGAINAALAASIPVFCLTLAGMVTAAHVTHSEQAMGNNEPLKARKSTKM